MAANMSADDRERTRTFSYCSGPSSEDEGNPDEQKVEDVSLEFLYKPRSITLLLLLLSWLIYNAFTRDDSIDQHLNFWHGAIGIAVVLSVVSVLICPNGPFTRPHPIVWRLVLGAGILYLLLMTFVLFQSYKDVKEMLAYIDPDLRHTGPDLEDYAVDCSFNFDIVWTRIDVFVVGHFFGWIVKAMLMRHAGLLWLLSIMWEVTEVAFSHLLENFKECWWDSILLDVLICNGLGLHIGLYLCKKLEMRKFYWESIKDIQGTTKKLRRAVLQFTPASWMHVRWMDPKCSYMRYLALVQLCIMWQVNELSAFFLKHIFMIPTKHPLVTFRIFLMVLQTAPALRQYYVYVTDTRCKRLGTQCWIIVCINFLEALVCMKHGRELFSRTDTVAIVWWIIFQLVVCFLAVYLMVVWRNWRNDGNGTTDENHHEKQNGSKRTKNHKGSSLSPGKWEGSPGSRRGLRFADENTDSDNDADDEEHGDRASRRLRRRSKRLAAK